MLIDFKSLVHGPDVSAWQDDDTTLPQIDFTKAKTAGASFVFVKASQGGFIDADFRYNWQAARAAGLLRGAYHLLDYRKPAKAQSEFFLRLLAGDGGELPPALDVERVAGWPLPARAALIEALHTFLTALEAADGRKPLLYTNPDLLRSVLWPLPGWLAETPLWIAHYGVQKPLVLAPWQRWTFWQFTDRADGRGYGMESRQVDMNLFNGGLEELNALAGGAGQPFSSPPTLEQRLGQLETEARRHGWAV